MPSTYLWVKLIHVTAAILWVGGVNVTTIFIAVYKRDGATMAALQKGMMIVSQFVLMPGAAVTLLSGIAMMVMLGGRPPVWMMWGLVAGPMASVIGAVFIRRTAQELGQMGANPNPDRARVAGLQTRLTGLSTAVVVVLLTAVAMMVLKPF